MSTNSVLHKESKGRQVTQKQVILRKLQEAGSVGLLNTELNENMLRFSQIIYLLKTEGYEIVKKNEGHGIVRYYLLSNTPTKVSKKARAIDILRDEVAKLDGLVYLSDIEDILDNNGLHVSYKPNRLNEEAMNL